MSQQSFRTVSASLQQTDVIVLIGNSTPMLGNREHVENFKLYFRPKKSCVLRRSAHAFRSEHKHRGEFLCATSGS